MRMHSTAVLVKLPTPYKQQMTCQCLQSMAYQAVHSQACLTTHVSYPFPYMGLPHHSI